MDHVFNIDFQEFIQALTNNDVDYILIGGYAVILHGYARTTGDMDIWVRRTQDNYNKLVKAFEEFKMPIFDMTPNNFLHNEAIDVFTFGVSPVRIDLMTKAKGLKFEVAFANSLLYEIQGIKIRLISKNDLIRMKKSANRPKDQNDVDNLGWEEE